MNSQQLNSIVLYCNEGGSDKEYQARIEPLGSGFQVIANYGKRGSATSKAVKSGSGPVSLEDAEKIFQKLIREKTAKGYRQVDAPLSELTQAAPTRSSPSPFRPPMLLNEISEQEALRLLEDPAWAVEMKLDGERLQLHRDDQSVTAYSRTGKLRAALPKAVIEAALAIRSSACFILDGELIEGVFYPFDILYLSGTPNIASLPQEFRKARLDSLIDGCFTQSLTVAETSEKQVFYHTLRTNGAEGIVFKLRSAAYQSGRPNSGGVALKFKFVATASVIIGKQNGAKRSVYMLLADGTEVGKVTIPPNKSMPNEGAIAEVRYLYAHRDGGLVQAVYLGERDDVAVSECTAAQFQYKGESRS